MMNRLKQLLALVLPLNPGFTTVSGDRESYDAGERAVFGAHLNLEDGNVQPLP